MRLARLLDPLNLKRIIPAKETSKRVLPHSQFHFRWVNFGLGANSMLTRTQWFYFILTLSAAAVTRAQISPVAAHDAAPIALAPLRVTADVWASPLARMPASVSVYDETSLRAGAVRHFGDLVDQIPNLTWTGGTSRPRYLQIRGLGENSQYEGETPDSAVRFLVDDFDFTGLGTIGSVFDVSQVEVLRGAQAGAFGANAAGGVIRLVTNAPTPFWTGLVESSAGSDALRTGSLALGGPLVASQPEQFMARVALQQTSSDGFRRNVTLQRATNARDEFTARVRLTWNPQPLWTWAAAAIAANFNNGFDAFALDNNGRLTYSDQPGRDEQRSLAASLRGTYRGWAAARFTTVTSGVHSRSIYSYDDDWTAASYAGFSDLRRERSVINQELRLDSEPLAASEQGDRWTLGAFFSSTAETSQYADQDPYSRRELATQYDARNIALFGQWGHNFTARTRLVVGLRAERIALTGNGKKMVTYFYPSAAEPILSLAPRFRDGLTGGKLVLEHELSDHEFAFLSLTRGYKAGGINIDARIDQALDPLTYASEYLWQYEAGLRGHWLEQQLTGDVTAFLIERVDTQIRDSAGFGGNYRFFTDNGKRANVAGLEAAGSYFLTKAWSLHGTVALMQSHLQSFTLSNGNVGGGRTLANTPRCGYTFSTSYRPASGCFASAEWVARAQQFDSNNQNESRRAFQVINATWGYAWPAWTLTLWAKNLLNENYDQRVFFFGNEDPDYLAKRYEDRAAPRQLGVTANYRF